MPLPDHVETTSERSAAMGGRPWLRLRTRRGCDEPGMVYAFTDGAARGSYAAVLVRPDGTTLEACRWRPPTRTRNVGAEWDGFLLGLELAPPGARLTVVVDLLWIHAQLIGVRRTIDPEIVEKLERAKALVEARRLDLVLVHHEGHQEDASDFTRWNARADALCDAEARARRSDPEGSSKAKRASSGAPRGRGASGRSNVERDMGSDQAFVDHVIDQLRGVAVTYRKMFGEYALYLDGKVVALVCDDQLFVKPTAAGRALLGEPTEAPPYPNAKPCFLIDDLLDDPEALTALVKATAKELPPAKPKRVAAKKKAPAKKAPAKKKTPAKRSPEEEST